MFQGKEKGKEKPTDPHGYGMGTETSPAAQWINDCCVLNIDERPKTLEASKIRKRRNVAEINACDNIRYLKNGKETTGGRCIFKPFRKTVFGHDYAEFEKWYQKETEKQIIRKKFGQMFGFTAEIHFPKPSEDLFAPGWVCDGIENTAPFHHNEVRKNLRIFDPKVEGNWRMVTKADQLCNPAGKKLNPFFSSRTN